MPTGAQLDSNYFQLHLSRMSASAKLIERFKTRPKDFNWGELQRMLKGMGYVESSGAGSRRKFTCDRRAKIILHEPHPSSVLKVYQLDDVRALLEREGLL